MAYGEGEELFETDAHGFGSRRRGAHGRDNLYIECGSRVAVRSEALAEGSGALCRALEGICVARWRRGDALGGYDERSRVECRGCGLVDYGNEGRRDHHQTDRRRVWHQPS